VVVAVLFGIQLIVMGIFRFAGAFASEDLTGGTRALLAVLGVLSLIIGLYAVRHVLITLHALALLLGILWIVSGLADRNLRLGVRHCLAHRLRRCRCQGGPNVQATEYSVSAAGTRGRLAACRNRLCGRRHG